MPDSVQINPVRYSAFLSYSHRDAAFARRLQRQLETYRLPAQLRGNPMLAAGETSRLKPIFRDRDELAAAADLPGAVREAIEASGHMIVICSASSAGSAWVKREVALFREIHGDHAILAAVCETIAPDIAPLILNAMFPEHDGPQPLAAHFNRHGDGARLALLKLVAALAGVRLDELAQRDAQRRSHDATRLGVAALAGMAIMAGLAVVAIKARGNAERERARGEKLIGFLLTNLRTELKGVGRLDLLDKVNTGVNDYFRAQDLSQMMDGALQQRAQLLQAAGEDDMARGKYEQARQQLVEGERTTAALLQAAPNDQERIFAHSQSEFWVGYVSWRLKEFATARAHFEAYLAHTQRLVQMDPNNPRWQREIGDANLNLGMFVCRRFLDLTRARSYFDASLDEFTVAAQSLPGDSDVLFGLVDSHAGLSDLELMQQHYERASAEREKVAQLLADWLKHDPTNAETRTRQAYNNLGFARIDIAQGATTKAIEQLQEGRAVAEQLAREDPENADARRQLRILALFEARAWMALPISVRPGDAQIDADIGDCDADGTKLDSHELATFCSILRAGYTGLSGHADAAHNQLSALRGETAISRGTLSERWGLDFDEEIAAMTAVINSRSK